jgi:HlyD family secretion protein
MSRAHIDLKRSHIGIIAGLAGIAALTVLALSGRATSWAGAGDPDTVDARGELVPPMIESLAAGPGRVEPLSEEVRVSSQLAGVLHEVLVDEGDRVTAGQVIARLDNDEYHARVAAAEADLRAREADARRVRNGARDEERQEAVAVEQEAQAVVDNSRADLARLRELAQEKVISQQELDRGEQAARVAQARLDAARQRASLVAASAREEDQARADSAVALTHARLNEARALLAKTTISSPIEGVVLRRHRKAGESVSAEFDAPIVTVADRSRLRVRVDVDETDVARIHVGQAAYVTADAFGSRQFPGRVVRVGQILGRKNFRTDEPTERVDTKILETLLELEDGHELPIGLRVQAFVAAAR